MVRAVRINWQCRFTESILECSDQSCCFNAPVTLGFVSKAVRKGVDRFRLDSGRAVYGFSDLTRLYDSIVIWCLVNLGRLTQH